MLRLPFMIGVAEDAQELAVRVALRAGADGNYATAQGYLDGSPISMLRLANYNVQLLSGGIAAKETPAEGAHYINMYELGDHASSTFNNMQLAAAIRA